MDQESIRRTKDYNSSSSYDVLWQQGSYKHPHNPIHHNRTKHVEVDQHFIREKIEQGEICMTYVSSKSQIADVLTKGIPREDFEDNVDKLGIIDIYIPTWRGVLKS